MDYYPSYTTIQGLITRKFKCLEFRFDIITIFKNFSALKFIVKKDESHLKEKKFVSPQNIA